MKTLDLDTILDMAIAKEIDANHMYLSLADRVKDPTSKDALLFLAKQEEGHKTLLEAFRRGEGVGKVAGSEGRRRLPHRGGVRRAQMDARNFRTRTCFCLQRDRRRPPRNSTSGWPGCRNPVKRRISSNE